MAVEIAYENGMLPRKTFNMSLEDIPIFLQWLPGIRPPAREFIATYPSEADSMVYAVIRDELEKYD